MDMTDSMKVVAAIPWLPGTTGGINIRPNVILRFVAQQVFFLNC